MNLFDAECELAVRLYSWATEEYAHQREYGYPMLRMLSSRRVNAILRLVEPLTSEQGNLLAAALLKRGHPKALRYLGQVPTDAEQALADRYIAIFNDECAQRASPPPPGVGPLAERRKLVGAAIRALKPLLGRPVERDVYDTSFHTQLGDWTLTTVLGSGRASINCEWTLVRSDHDMNRFSVGGGDPMGHTASFDYTSLLGFGLQTSWEDVTQEALEVRLVGLRAICSHVLHGLPPLLEGLSRLPDPR